MIRVVIVGGDQPRSKNLLKDLQDSGFFQVIIQPRVNESNLVGAHYPAISSAEAYGRTLSISERCCSLAHRLAQEKLATTGGIILEDDAVVLDFQALADFAAQVIDSDQNILLNFSTLRCSEDVDWNLTNNSIIRTVGPSSLAVGYAGSANALRQLIEANFCLEYVADWPPINARHLRLKYPIVAHGHRNNMSLITGTTNRSQVSIFELVVRRQIEAAFGRVKSKILFELTKAILWLRRAKK